MYSAIDSQKTSKIYQLRLQISPAVQSQAWKQADRKQSNAIARYQAYMNYVCLYTFLKWLKEWLEETPVDKPTVWHENDLPSMWEFVNGAAIQLGETRLVLIPADATEMEDLSVPREWVDNPKWKADYYLAVAVNLDGDESDCWIEICGFATHRQLYHEGCYNEGDRTYRLEMEDLNTDLMVMELTLGLHLQREVKPLPRLCQVEVQEMLRKLGKSLVSSPKLRLTVKSFEKWLALLDNDKWRQYLYNWRMTGGPSLRERLERVFDETWQTVAEVIDTMETPETSLAFASRGVFRFRDSNNLAESSIPELISLLSTSNDKLTRLEAIELLGHKAKENKNAIACLTNLLNTSTDEDLRREAAVILGEIDPDNSQAGIKKFKMIELGTSQHKVALVSILMPGSDRDKMQIYLLVNSVGSKFLPLDLEMAVLDENGSSFDKIKSRKEDNAMQLDFSGEEGDRFTVKLALGDDCFTEEFVIKIQETEKTGNRHE